MILLDGISLLQEQILNHLQLALAGALPQSSVRPKLDMSDIPDDGRCVIATLAPSGPYEGLKDTAPLQTAKLEIVILTHLMEDVTGSECLHLSAIVQHALCGFLPACKVAECIYLGIQDTDGPNVLDSFRAITIDYKLIIEFA